MHHLIPALAACTLLAVLPATAQACDNLRMNQSAYQRCVQNMYGPNASSGRPAYLTYEYWDRRAREQAEQEAAREAAAPSRRPPPPPPRPEPTPAETAALVGRWLAEADVQRGFRKRTLQRELDARSVERRVLREVGAAVAAAQADGSVSADEYQAVLALAYPHAPLMVEWSQAAAQAHGGRFKVMAGLALVLGCADRKPVLIGIELGACPVAVAEQGYQSLADLLPTLSPGDRLLACLPLRVRASWITGDGARSTSSNPAERESHARWVQRIQSQWSQCEKHLAGVPPSALKSLDMLIAERTLPTWMLALHPVLRTEADWADPAALLQLANQAKERQSVASTSEELRRLTISRHEKQGIDLSWGTPLEPPDFDGEQLNLAANEAGWKPLRAEQLRLYQLGQWADAAAAGEAALRFNADRFATDNQERLQALVHDTLGQTYWKLGQLDKAEQSLLRAEALWRREAQEQFGFFESGRPINHIASAAPRAALAQFYEGTQRCAQATPHRQAVWALTVEVYGPRRPASARALEGLAGNQACLGQHRQAAITYEKALAVWATRGDAARHEVAAVLARLAQVRVQAGQAEEGATHLRRALELREQLGGADAAATRELRKQLAVTLRSTGAFAEAERLDPQPPPAQRR